MFTKLLLALGLMGACVALHSVGMVVVIRWLQRKSARPAQRLSGAAWRLIRVAAWTVLLHLFQILIWAAAYVIGNAMPDLTAATYFSAVTYTTTGYGDLVLPWDWRLVGGIEALTGILMCGLSTGMFFAAFSQMFGLESRIVPSQST